MEELLNTIKSILEIAGLPEEQQNEGIAKLLEAAQKS